MPAALGVTPIRPTGPGEGWRLRDATGSAVELTGLPGDPWLLLACSGGGPITVFGEWSPRGFRPLSVLADDRGIGFSTAMLGQAA